MSDNEEQLTIQEALDEAEETTYHTILEIWREVLKPAAQEAQARITPQWANRICSAYRELNFADMPVFKNLYFDLIDEFTTILDVEIDGDEECLNLTSPAEDVEHNGKHYLQVLIDWQRAILTWELSWECTDVTAAATLAAISEVHRMFFDNTGLTSLLDNINFEITDDDRDLLASALQELRDSTEE